MTETVYAIRDINNVVVAEHVRIDDANGEKRYIWRLPGQTKWGLQGLRTTDLPLYRIAELSNQDTAVILVEGERACDALWNIEYISVATVCGASATPSDQSLAAITVNRVYLFPDNDEVGRQHMTRIAQKLLALGHEVRMIDSSSLPEHGDAVEAVQFGLIDKLLEGSQPVALAATTVKKQQEAAVKIDANNATQLYQKEVERTIASLQSGKPLALSWGFPTLDKLTGGLRPGLFCAHGEPGSGKSLFALQVASRSPAIYVSAEMSALELLRRLVAHVTQTDKQQVMSGYETEQNEMRKLQQTLAIAKDLQLVDASSSVYKAQHLSDDILKLKQTHEHVLVVIDSLHSWALPLAEEGSSEYEAINGAMVALRAISSKHQVPILFLAERNRSSMKQGGLSAVAGSRKAEYGADMVMSLDWDQQSNPEGGLELTNDAPREVVLRILKNRFGAPGAEIHMMADLAYQTFSEVY